MLDMLRAIGTTLFLATLLILILIFSVKDIMEDTMEHKEALSAISEKGQLPISDGHDSERIWHNGRYIEYYRKVFADAMGIDADDIPDDMYIHHIDGNRMNNDIDNLMLCTRKAHENLEVMLHPDMYDPE